MTNTHTRPLDSRVLGIALSKVFNTLIAFGLLSGCGGPTSSNSALQGATGSETSSALCVRATCANCTAQNVQSGTLIDDKCSGQLNCATCATTAPVNLGCFADEPARDVANLTSLSPVTVETCIQTCKDGNYAIAALQDRYQCFCSNSYGKYGSLSADQCSDPCGGNPTEICGGAWANSLYTTTVACVPTTCAAQQKNCGTIPDGCGGTLNCGGCGNGQPCATNLCTYGCYADEPTHDLPNLVNAADANGHLTVESCLQACTTANFAFAGLHGGLCYCGNSFGKYGPVSADSCAYKCSGNVDTVTGAPLSTSVENTSFIEICGGDNTNSIFPTGAHCTPTTCAAQGKSCGTIPDGCGGTLNCGGCGSGQTCITHLCTVGCFADQATRDLPNQVDATDANGHVTIESCIGTCKTANFTYAGLQVGNQCFCGNTYGSYGPLTPDSCATKCTGDTDTSSEYPLSQSVEYSEFIEVCGGPYANSVFPTAQSGCGTCADGQVCGQNGCVTPRAATLGISVSAAGALISGTGTPGVTYEIQASSNLTSWSNIAALTADVSGNFSYTDTSGNGARFYRAIVL